MDSKRSRTCHSNLCSALNPWEGSGGGGIHLWRNGATAECWEDKSMQRRASGSTESAHSADTATSGAIGSGGQANAVIDSLSP